METIAWPGPGFQHLLNRATSMIEKRDRSILAVAGAPGSGKSTLAGEVLLAVEERYPGQVALVGMDGFHLAQRVLDTTGWAAVKGAPQTFDANGYIDLLQRIHAHPGRRIYAPEFRREIEDSIAHAVVISPDVRLVITEGNYLLLDEEPWARVRPLLDEAWFIHLDDPERRR